MDATRKHDLLVYLVKRLVKERLDNGGFMPNGLLELMPPRGGEEGASTQDLWLAFRALVNVREPWPADHDLLAAQDELLQGLIAEAGITAVGATAASPLDPRLRLWRGDITTLAIDAIVNAANDGMTGFHIHVAEGMNDVYDSLQNYGRRPVQRLQDHGILGPKTILGHCIHVNTAEMDIIKATDTMCVNNPESNMGNAVGISPVLQLYKKGILIGLGTDAYTNDMLESIKVALCSQRHNACMPNVGWCEVTDMLFRNNAKMAERTGFPTLGVLKPGAAADVIVMDYKPFTPFSDANIDGHMLFGMTGRQCQTTMINGRILMKDRVLTEIDEEAVNAHILESSKRLWGRLNHKEY